MLSGEPQESGEPWTGQNSLSWITNNNVAHEAILRKKHCVGNIAQKKEGGIAGICVGGGD